MINSDLKYNLDRIKKLLPDHVKLIAVSKFHAVNEIQNVYDAGQTIFGENRVQELNVKKDSLPGDIQWHFIGHLQKNKIKTIVPFIHTIQSVDSWHLLVEINKYAKLENRKINCFLEMHIAQEDSKYGFSFDSCRQMLRDENWQLLNNVNVVGLMGMATYSDDSDLVRNEFRSLKQFFDELKSSFFQNEPQFTEISMGMSHDFRLAIDEGATIVRIGTAIFGERK